MKLAKVDLISVLLSVGIFMAAIGLNPSDFGGPSFLSSNRLSYILVLVLFLLVTKGVVPFKAIKTFIYFYSSFIFLYIFSGLASSIAHGFNEAFFVRTISWLFSYVISIGLCAIIYKEEYRDWHKLGKLIFFGYVVLFFYVLFFLREELFSSSFRIFFVREKLSLLSEGQTRFITGLVWIYFISYLYLFHERKLVKTFFLVSINITLFFILLLCGSRQSMLAMLVFNFILFFKFSFKSLVSLVCLFSLVLFSLIYLYHDSNMYVLSLYERVVTSSTQQYASGYARTEVYRDAIIAFNSSPLLGIGPEHFPSHNLNTTGLTTHNDFLKILSESGVFISFVIFGFMFSICTFFMYRNFKTNYFPFKVFASSLITTILVFSNFNTVFHEVIFSMFFALTFSTYRLTKVGL